jgi:hypothetical protein
MSEEREIWFIAGLYGMYFSYGIALDCLSHSVKINTKTIEYVRVFGKLSKLKLGL